MESTTLSERKERSHRTEVHWGIREKSFILLTFLKRETKMKIKKICNFCKTEFTILYKKRNRIYCSKTCSNKASIKRVSKRCKYCNKFFKLIPSKITRINYCSDICARNSRKKRESRVCKTCGEIFDRKLSKLDRGKNSYCSQKCVYKGIKTTKVVKCFQCNKIIEVSKYRYKNMSRLFCSKKCFRENNVGKNHPLYLDGRSFEPYGFDFNDKFKRFIRERDNFTCQLCKKHETGKKKFSIHHIDYIKINNFTFNLITLCKHCHALTNYNRENWTLFFQNYLSERYGYKYHLLNQKKIGDFVNAKPRI